MSRRDDAALRQLLAREIRKLETQVAVTEELERKLAREGRELPEMADPTAEDLDGLARAEQDHPREWLARRLAFLRFLERRVERANARERAYFWLGACATFLRPSPARPGEFADAEERLRQALRYYGELERATQGADAERRREEPWDGSDGLAPRRRMLASWILREALDLLAEQERAFQPWEDDET